MTSRKFYKSTMQITVLSEEPFHWESLADIDYEITYGECTGAVEDLRSNEVLNGTEVAKELTSVGSEPGFFQLDENGNDEFDE